MATDKLLKAFIKHNKGRYFSGAMLTDWVHDNVPPAERIDTCEEMLMHKDVRLVGGHVGWAEYTGGGFRGALRSRRILKVLGFLVGFIIGWVIGSYIWEGWL